MKPIYESDYLKLGLKIAYYRKLRGLTQEQLAEEIDRTPAFIGHIEAPNISKAKIGRAFRERVYVLV